MRNREKGIRGDRARTRDGALFGSATADERRVHHRNRPAQQPYRAAARPTDQADVMVDNDEPEQPAWEVRPADQAQK